MFVLGFVSLINSLTTGKKPAPRPISYHPLTPHGTEGDGWQGAGPEGAPRPGTEHPPRAVLAAHEVRHLNHLVSRSRYRVEILLRLSKRVPAMSFSAGLRLSKRVPAMSLSAGLARSGVVGARHTRSTVTEGLRRARARPRRPAYRPWSPSSGRRWGSAMPGTYQISLVLGPRQPLDSGELQQAG